MARDACVAALAIVVTGVASYLMTARLFTAAERGLATLRVKAFRHVHDLPVLTQNTERRGALVSRVTSDVDQVSQFLLFGGIIAVVSVGQIVVATVVMAVLLLAADPRRLALLPAAVPVAALLPAPALRAYGVVRRQVGDMLRRSPSPSSAPPSSAPTRSRPAPRTASTTPIDRHRRASTRAQGLTAFTFSLGGISAGLANAGVLIVGVLLGVDGQITAGKVLAFAFLVTLFVGPVQMGTQVLTDAQNAIAGWRRVIGILDTPADVVDPGAAGTPLPHGRGGDRVRGRRASPTPAGRRCCTTSTSRSPRTPGSRSWGRPGRARPRSPSC